MELKKKKKKKNPRLRIRRTYSDLDQTLSKIENLDEFSRIMIGLCVSDEEADIRRIGFVLNISSMFMIHKVEDFGGSIAYI